MLEVNSIAKETGDFILFLFTVKHPFMPLKGMVMDLALIIKKKKKKKKKQNTMKCIFLLKGDNMIVLYDFLSTCNLNQREVEIAECFQVIKLVFS